MRGRGRRQGGLSVEDLPGAPGARPGRGRDFLSGGLEAIEDPHLIDEALVEHASAKQLIAEIEAEAGDSLHDAKVKVLAEQIRHHVEEEEKVLFPEVIQSGLDLEDLGEQLAARKMELLEQLAEGADAD